MLSIPSWSGLQNPSQGISIGACLFQQFTTGRARVLGACLALPTNPACGSRRVHGTNPGMCNKGKDGNCDTATKLTNRLQRQQMCVCRIVRLARWGGRTLGSIFQAPHRKSLTSPSLLLRKYPFVSIFRYEIHNFLYRTEPLCSKSFWEGDAGAHHQVGACGCLVPSARTNENTGYTRQPKATFHLATSVDY